MCVYIFTNFSPCILMCPNTQQADFDALMEKDNSPPAELSDYWAIQPRRTDMIMKWFVPGLCVHISMTAAVVATARLGYDCGDVVASLRLPAHTV